MRRLALIGLAGLALVAVLGTTTVAMPFEPFSVKASQATPGGHLLLKVHERGHRGGHSVKYDAAATVYFSSGPATAAMHASGKDVRAMSVKFSVSKSEHPGWVPVSVAVTVDGHTFVLHTWATIRFVNRNHH
jgi:hypothetical protein